MWAGLSPWERCATLRGELLPQNTLKKVHFWKFSMLENKLVMSAYHLSEANADTYINALQTYRPHSLEGFPSAIYALAKFMLARNIRLKMKAVLTTSETLLNDQKVVIQEAFKCQVFDYYGMAERVAAIHTCEKGRYHIIPEYSVVEYLKNPDLPKGCYELVGTSLTNMANPLIRYKVGDVVELSKEKCPCGRHYQVIDSIIGRSSDYIVTPKGKLVGRAALDHLFKGSQNVVHAQFYQPEINRIVLRIVPGRCFKIRDAQYILKKLERRLGEGISYEIESLKEIPRGGRGKLQSVISKVNTLAGSV